MLAQFMVYHMRALYVFNCFHYANTFVNYLLDLLNLVSFPCPFSLPFPASLASLSSFRFRREETHIVVLDHRLKQKHQVIKYHVNAVYVAQMD